MNGESTAYLNEENSLHSKWSKNLDYEWFVGSVLRSFAKVNGKMTAFIVDKEMKVGLLVQKKRNLALKVLLLLQCILKIAKYL